MFFGELKYSCSVQSELSSTLSIIAQVTQQLEFTTNWESSVSIPSQDVLLNLLLEPFILHI